MDFLPLPRNAEGLEEGKEKQKPWWAVRGRALLDKWVTGDTLFGGYMILWFIGLAAQFRSRENMTNPTELEKWVLDRVDLYWTTDYYRDNLWIPVTIGVLYVALITLGPRIMKSRERPAWLKKWIIAWNVLLVIFSTGGAYRMLPLTLNEMFGEPILNLQADFPGHSQSHNMLCHGAVERGRRYPMHFFWMFLFCTSKIPEMIDTVLLVLTKKNIIFLHWFHHLTVMLFCWVSWAHQTPVGIVYAAMNYCVHSLMYAWYGFAAKGYKPKRLLSQTVTVLQIVQMVIGSSLAVYVAVAPDCSNHKVPVFTGLWIYGTYLALFVNFYINAYCRKRSRKGKKKKQPESKKQK